MSRERLGSGLTNETGRISHAFEVLSILHYLGEMSSPGRFWILVTLIEESILQSTKAELLSEKEITSLAIEIAETLLESHMPLPRRAMID